MFFENLETERLKLKIVDRDDAEFWMKQFLNEEVHRYLYDEDPCASIEDAYKWIDIFNEPEPRTQNRWILIKKENGEKIGTCGIHCWNKATGSCEIGWDLYPTYWKQGYMSEALSTILEFIENTMKIKKIEAHISVDNMDSIRLATKHGFVDAKDDYMEVCHGKEYLHRKYVKTF